MGSIVVETAQEKLKDLNDLEPYAMNEVKQIVKMVKDLRVSLGDKLTSKQNLKGCLNGKIDDYLMSYESQEQQIQDKFHEDREFLQRQVDGDDYAMNAEIDKFESFLDGMQGSIERILKSEPMKKLVVKRLPNFGQPIPDHTNNFEWPETKDIQQLRLKTNMRLKAIKTKGRPDSVLTAM